MGYDIAKLEGKTFKATIHPDAGGCGACMFSCFSCCGACPFTFKIKKIDENKMAFYDYYAGPCAASPCPCCIGCALCVPPCKQYLEHVRDPSNPDKWIGTKTSVLQGGCCVAACHHEGDFFEASSTQDGSTWEKRMYWGTGANPAAPPCLHNTKMVWMTETSVKVQKGGGAPENDEMTR